MESPIQTVRRFCAAWSDNMGAAELAAFFTEDAVYHNIPQAPVTGRQNIASTIDSFLRPGPPGIESIDFRVINIADTVVLTLVVDRQRVSSIAHSRHPIAAPVCGVSVSWLLRRADLRPAARVP